jgi:hypothetical protein
MGAWRLRPIENFPLDLTGAEHETPLGHDAIAPAAVIREASTDVESGA